MEYNKILQYNILNSIDLRIKIRNIGYDIPDDILFEMAARKNPKRSFLFVSKILGKHIPVHPLISLLGGAALGVMYGEKACNEKSIEVKEIISAIKNKDNISEVYDKIMKNSLSLKEPTLFIGFAETATALGHSVFSCFKKNGFYIHTTRESIIENRNLITFEEEHSHATSHRIYPWNFPILESTSPIVLVDDEITTGKTCLNIIAAIHKLFPRKKYTVLSLLDWRTDRDKEEYKTLEKELDVEINTLSLMAGTIDVNGKVINEAVITKNENGLVNDDIRINYIYLDSFFREKISFSSVKYLKYTGRFGICTEEDKILDEQTRKAGEFLSEKRGNGKILCMGTGEFMYIPMKIAAYMGENVLFQSTTRSPIYPNDIAGYGVKNAFVFQNPENEEITNYFYNVPYKYYDELYVFFEKEVDEEKMKPLLFQLRSLGIKNINVVICSSK